MKHILAHLLLAASLAGANAAVPKQPNVILIMTDDQGYGDMACHGNPRWSFGEINRLPRVTGPWMVDVKKAGRYRLTLRQFPAEAAKPVEAVRAKLQTPGRKWNPPSSPEPRASFSR